MPRPVQGHQRHGAEPCPSLCAPIDVRSKTCALCIWSFFCRLQPVQGHRGRRAQPLQHHGQRQPALAGAPLLGKLSGPRNRGGASRHPPRVAAANFTSSFQLRPSLQAPEILEEHPATCQSDVYAFGITMWEVSRLFNETFCCGCCRCKHVVLAAHLIPALPTYGRPSLRHVPFAAHDLAAAVGQRPDLDGEQMGRCTSFE